MPTISVIIPAHGGGAVFQRCVDAIGHSGCVPDEVIIVADGPIDDALNIARNFGASVLLNEKAMGPAIARNQGASVAIGDIFFFVDADVEVGAGTIEHVLELFKLHPKIDALIGSYDNAPADHGLVSRFRNLLHHFTHQHSSEEASTFWGACGAIKREAFEAVSGFDERFGKPSIEDIEMGYRLRSAGYTIRLEAALQVKHLKHWTLLSMIRTDLFQRALPWTDLILSENRTERDLNLTNSNRLSVLSILLALLLTGMAVILPNGIVPVYILPILIVILFTFYLTLNAPFYRLLLNTNGFLFMMACIPLHALFYTYSGMAYAIGVTRFYFRRIIRAQNGPR